MVGAVLGTIVLTAAAGAEASAATDPEPTVLTPRSRATAESPGGATFALAGAPAIPSRPLIAADGAAFDLFGESVAISGDTAVVGAWYDDVGDNVDQGSAYVFIRSGDSWSQQAQLKAADGAAFDYFGISVAVSGDTVVVGTASDEVGGNVEQGSAYVFTRTGTAWSQQARLTASDGAEGDYFGAAVALFGDTVVVGAAYDDVGGSIDRGSAYVFTRSGSAWSQQAQLTAADGAANDAFGQSVAVFGDTALVGAVLDDVGAKADQGSAYVFTRSGAGWSQQAQLTASDGAAGDFFGVSVALSVDTAVVGATWDDVGGNAAQGSASVFTRSGGVWSQQARLTAADGAASDGFGASVAISGDTVVVGAAYDDIGQNTDQGSAYAFARTGGTWSQDAHLTAADSGAAYDSFGASVGISGDTVVVGARYDEVGANIAQGSAYVFILEPRSTTLGDFDGDGKADLSVFRPASQTWFVHKTSGGDIIGPYGNAGDIPVPADYDGDGKTDLAVFRPATGTWFIHKSSGGDTAGAYGKSGDIPVPADYDGDGKADIAVFRPTTGTWFVHKSSGGDTASAYGNSGDIPVPADYDGDGKADIAVFRPAVGTWFVHRTSGGDVALAYGLSGDVPVPADYDGDRKADVAVFRPSTSTWFIHKTTGGDTIGTYGRAQDIPVPADYDGDGKTDLAVFRPSTGTWFVHQSSGGDVAGSYGVSGDIPLQGPLSIRGFYF